MVFEFCDSIVAYRDKKPSKIVERVASGDYKRQPICNYGRARVTLWFDKRHVRYLCVDHRFF